MDPVQLLVVAAIVVGVIVFDRRVRRSGLVEPGSGEAWTGIRLARLLVKGALALAIVALVVLGLQALQIEIGYKGFGPEGPPAP